MRGTCPILLPQACESTSPALHGRTRKGFFETLASSFEIKPAPVAPPTLPTSTAFKKYLTTSYRDAFPFRGPRTPFAVADDSYACAVSNAVPAEPAASPSRALSWGQLYSFLLKQPKLAEEAGLVQAASFTLDDPALLADGGWLYVDLHPDGHYGAAAAHPGMLARFAARLPPLEPAESRPLFGAVQFPVMPPPLPGPGEEYDRASSEALSYDDGFAKIVHGYQPRLSEVVPGIEAAPLSKDFGIRLGWDDEQVLIWMNRQIKADPADPTRPEVDVPMGVAGYRIDVREEGETIWHSLTRARGPVTVGAQALGTFDGELGVEAVPIQLDSKKAGEYWLPSYFTTWRGSSLVFPDHDEFILAGLGDVREGRVLQPVDDRAVSLRYGRTYEFRVRLRDLTGGGPTPADTEINPGPARITSIPFRRFVRPQQVIAGHVAELPPGATTLTIPIFRPLLSYPAAMYTGLPDARDKLLADVETAKKDEREPAIPDPNVQWLEIQVTAEDVDLYTTMRAFPTDAAAPLPLKVEFSDVHDITTKSWPVDEPGPVIVPTARRVRLSLTAVGRADEALEYFGTEEARRSPQAVSLELRAPSRNELELFIPGASSPIKAFYARLDSMDSAAQEGGGGKRRAISWGGWLLNCRWLRPA
ncbi:hypothetical protein [Nonomuraea salmonea]|uniref:hypothetical protein n=1 Tax=Nonomuraea salmonea TaxID=46181 RepID=UPI0031F18ED3